MKIFEETLVLFDTTKYFFGLSKTFGDSLRLDKDYKVTKYLENCSFDCNRLIMKYVLACPEGLILIKIVSKTIGAHAFFVCMKSRPYAGAKLGWVSWLLMHPKFFKKVSLYPYTVAC